MHESQDAKVNRPELGVRFFFIGSAMRGVGAWLCGEDQHSGSLMSNRRSWIRSRLEFLAFKSSANRLPHLYCGKRNHMPFGSENT